MNSANDRDTHGQELAETYVKMLSTHDPGLVDPFEAEDYINHNAVVADSRSRAHHPQG